MAEARVTELPTVSLEGFTPNDRFLILDDGRARQLPLSVFKLWLVENVKGEKGEQGVAGRDGKDGVNGTNGEKGDTGLSAYQLAVSQGYSESLNSWLNSLKGERGQKGLNGDKGWTPLLRVVPRGSDAVLQLFDWFGGTGEKPTNTGYLGESGIVVNISNAVNIRGERGDRGEVGRTGTAGRDGVDGVDGKDISRVSFNSDNSFTIVFSDESSITSDKPSSVVGFGSYSDGQFQINNPLLISANSQEVLPNDASNKVEKLPTGINSFYNTVTQRYQIKDTDALYNIRLRFKLSPDSTASFMNISFSEGTSDLIYSNDLALRGDNKVQDVDVSTLLQGTTALSSNGLSIRLKTSDRDIKVYNIEVVITKIS